MINYSSPVLKPSKLPAESGLLADAYKLRIFQNLSYHSREEAEKTGHNGLHFDYLTLSDK